MRAACPGPCNISKTSKVVKPCLKNGLLSLGVEPGVSELAASANNILVVFVFFVVVPRGRILGCRLKEVACFAFAAHFTRRLATPNHVMHPVFGANALLP